MKPGPYFDKAWQRRDYEFEQAMLERDERRFGHVRKILPPPAFPLTKLPLPKPSKGGYITPWNWTEEERKALKLLDKGLEPISNEVMTRACIRAGVITKAHGINVGKNAR